MTKGMMGIYVYKYIWEKKLSIYNYSKVQSLWNITGDLFIMQHEIDELGCTVVNSWYIDERKEYIPESSKSRNGKSTRGESGNKWNREWMMKQREGWATYKIGSVCIVLFFFFFLLQFLTVPYRREWRCELFVYLRVHPHEMSSPMIHAWILYISLTKKRHWEYKEPRNKVRMLTWLKGLFLVFLFSFFLFLLLFFSLSCVNTFITLYSRIYYLPIFFSHFSSCFFFFFFI